MGQFRGRLRAVTRWFNTAGPCVPSDHYFLPPEQRLPGIDRLVEQKTYFVLHAPRQVGKTTAMMAFAQRLTADGRFAALMVSAEVGRPSRATQVPLKPRSRRLAQR